MTAAGGASQDLGRLNLCSSAPRVFVSLSRLHADVVGYRLPGRVQHTCDDPLVGLSSVALNSAAGVGLRFLATGHAAVREPPVSRTVRVLASRAAANNV
jgi:hypothetical protein